MPYVLREWSAPETLINSLADGTGIDASVAATKSSFADFLVKGGVAPAQAAEAADALVHRIIDNLAHGGSPETAIATAKEDIGGVIDHLVRAAAEEGPRSLDQALAQGDPQALARVAHELGVDHLPPEAQKAAITAWQSALANGADGAHAREAALDGAQSAIRAAADGAVELSHGDSLAAHLAGGGPEAAVALKAMTQGLPGAQAAALMNSLTAALAGGSQPSDALQTALESARSAKATGDGQGVAVSQADMLVAALAGGGDVRAVLAAAGLSGGGIDAFLNALAGNAGSGNALAFAQASQHAADQALAQASAGVKGSALAAALASGGADAAAALAGMGGDGAGREAFINALSQALASGASLDSAIQSADSSASQTAAFASATGSPLMAALASGQNAGAVLAAAMGNAGADGGQAFTAALSNALANGASVEAALQQANAASSAAESQVAGSSSPIGSDSPPGASAPGVPGPASSDPGSSIVQSPATPTSPSPSSPSSPAPNSSPPPLSIAQMLNPGGDPDAPPPPPPTTPDLPQVTPTPPPATLSQPTAPPSTPPPFIVAATGPTILTGMVVDGPIKGARVFVDANNNGVWDTGEYSVLTDATGRFSISADKLAAGRLRTVYSDDARGIDTTTGQVFKVTLSAPLGETNLTGINNLIAAVMDKGGLSKADAAKAVATAIGAPASVNLLSYDPSSAANQGSDIAKMAANLLVIVSGVASTLTGSGAAATDAAMSAAIGAIANQVTSGATLSLTGGSATNLIAAVMADAKTTVGQSATSTSVLADTTSNQMVQIISSLVSNITNAGSAADVNAATKTALGDASSDLATIAQNKAVTATDNSAAATSNLTNSVDYALAKYTGSGLATTLAAAKTDITNNQGDTTAPSPPVAVADSAAITQNAGVTIQVLANDSDPQGKTLSLLNIVHLDSGSTVTRGVITVNADGSVTYNPGHAFDYLAVGETATDSFGYVLGNGTGQNATGTATVTITGTNDAPTIVAGTTSANGAITERANTTGSAASDGASGSIAFADVDLTDGHAASSAFVSAVWTKSNSTTAAHANPGALTLGTLDNSAKTVGWSYSTADSALDFLGAGETLAVTYNVAVSDGHGGSVTKQVTVTITGTNDAPTVTASALATSDDHSAKTGSVTASDPDTNDTVTFHLTGGGTVSSSGGLETEATSHGTVTLNTATGSYIYTPTGEASLALNQTDSDSFQVLATDNHTLSSTAGTVAVTITGSNDAPTIGVGTPSVPDLVEDGGVANATVGVSSSSIHLTLGDVDGTASYDTAWLTSHGWSTSDSGLTYTEIGTYGVATLTVATNMVSYALSNSAPATEALATGQTVTDSFTVGVTDTIAPTQTANAVFSIKGADDTAPETAGTSDATTIHLVAPSSQGSGHSLVVTGHLYTTTLASNYPVGYDIVLTAGRIYQFDLVSTALPGYAALSDPYIAISSSFVWNLNRSSIAGDPNVIRVNDDGNPVLTPFGQHYNSRLFYGSLDGSTKVNSDTGGSLVVYASAYPNATGYGYTLTVTYLADPLLSSVSENATDPCGETVAALFSDTHPAQVSITESFATSDQGHWQFSTNGGSDWISLPCGAASGITLNPDDLLRFVPTENWNGTAGNLLVGLIDASGSVASYEVVSTSVNAVNNAPLASGEAHLPTVAENAAAPEGATVATLLATHFSDAADAVPGGSAADALVGIAIVGDRASHDQGVWQYSADHGTHWTAIDAGVSDATALVMSAFDELRFLPGHGFEGAPGALSVRLIESGGDQPITGSVVDLSATSATGGSSHVSADTVNISTSVTPGPTVVDDHALGFNGSNHVDVAAAAALEPTAALTVEAWVQFSAAGGSIIDDLSANGGYKLAVDAGGHLQFTVGNGTSTTTVTSNGASLSDGAWHDVAATYDNSASTMHLYVDNNDVADLTGITPNALGASTFASLIMGSGMNGALNDVRIWSTANSQAQIVQETSHTMTGNESGLVGYWTFDEHAGNYFANSVSGSNYGIGTSSGTPSFIDLANQNSSAEIMVSTNASSYKGMILAAASNGDGLSYSVDNNGAPAHGSVVFNNNAFVYSPESGHIAQDDHFTVDITDNATHAMSAHTMTLHAV